MFTCCFLHSLIIGKKHVDIQTVLHILWLKATQDHRNLNFHPPLIDSKAYVGIERQEHSNDQH